MSTESLFDLAREDGPSTRERDAMWDHIASATGAGAAVSTAAALKAGAPASAASSVGGVATSILATIGTAIVALALSSPDVGERSQTSPKSAPHATQSIVAKAEPPRETTPTPTARAAIEPTSIRVAVPAGWSSGAPSSALETRAAPEADRPAARATPPPRAEARPADVGDALAREADLVSRARTALRTGDPAGALVLVRQARAEGAHALDPEEMNLESRALRALGRADEAAAVDVALRLRHPGHALAR
jgi:hypothetical protein